MTLDKLFNTCSGLKIRAGMRAPVPMKLHINSTPRLWQRPVNRRRERERERDEGRRPSTSPDDVAASLTHTTATTGEMVMGWGIRGHCCPAGRAMGTSNLWYSGSQPSRILSTGNKSVRLGSPVSSPPPPPPPPHGRRRHRRVSNCAVCASAAAAVHSRPRRSPAPISHLSLPDAVFRLRRVDRTVRSIDGNYH